MNRITLSLLFVLLIGTTAELFSAPNVLVTDLAGTPVARLPFMNRGDVRIVPLAMLGKWAGYETESLQGKDHVMSPGCTTILEVRNSFAEVNGTFVQMLAPAESWDGSIWLPLANLDQLFPTTIELSESGEVIRLLGIADSTDGIVKLIEAETKSTPSSTWTLGKVTLDPGHGGKDPGGKGLFELIEKEVTLDIARRAESLLQKAGIPVLITRKDDKFLTLGERTRQANAEAGDLFLSIHCNSYTDPMIGGAECYILKPAKSERAIEVASVENQVVELEREAEQYEQLTEENYILLAMATSQYLRDSERWAEVLLDELTHTTGVSSRGVDQAGFYVLMGASMPAILLECGYLSNPEDARVLGSERGRQKVAEAITASIVKMKSEMESASR